MSLGKNIASLRKDQGMTQAQLGERLGVSNQAISKWEQEMNLPDVMLLPQIAKVFGVTIDRLFEGCDASVQTRSAERFVWVLREEHDDANLVIRYPVEACERMMQVQIEASGVHLSDKDWKAFEDWHKKMRQPGMVVETGDKSECKMTMEVVRYED